MERRGRGNTGHRARAHPRHTGMPRVLGGGASRCSIRRRTTSSPPRCWLAQGRGSQRVEYRVWMWGADARRRAHDTHAQKAQGKITAPFGGACGRRTSFPIPSRDARHLGRTHAEHCATTASTARGGRWTCKGSGATHSGSPEEDLLGDPRCSWAMNKRCYKPLEETPDRVDENLISRS